MDYEEIIDEIDLEIKRQTAIATTTDSLGVGIIIGLNIAKGLLIKYKNDKPSVKEG